MNVAHLLPTKPCTTWLWMERTRGVREELCDIRLTRTVGLAQLELLAQIQLVMSGMVIAEYKLPRMSIKQRSRSVRSGTWRARASPRRIELSSRSRVNEALLQFQREAHGHQTRVLTKSYKQRAAQHTHISFTIDRLSQSRPTTSSSI